MFQIQLKTFLPAFYHSLIPSEILEMELQEVKATCNSCLMATPQGLKLKKINYLPELKCCTFHPFLPNYAVGALLEASDAKIQEGKDRLLKKIQNQKGVLPLGIVADPNYQFDFLPPRS